MGPWCVTRDILQLDVVEWGCGLDRTHNYVACGWYVGSAAISRIVRSLPLASKSSATDSWFEKPGGDP